MLGLNIPHVLPVEADAWIAARVAATGPIEVTRVRPWSTIAKVPTREGDVWFKACAPVQAFEPRLTAVLAEDRPELMPGVLAWDASRRWLLLHDAGPELRARGNPPEVWLELLPRYADLQRADTHRAAEHVAHGVPDLRTATLPSTYTRLFSRPLPLETDEVQHLRAFEPQFARWCVELAGAGVDDTIQHDDLHYGNVHLDGGRPRVLDWGDSCVSHPFASLVVTFRFLEEVNGFAPDHPWFARLRDAYLEPYGRDRREVFELAQRVGTFAHAIAWVRQRDALDDEARADFDVAFQVVLRRAVALAMRWAAP